MSQSDIAHLGQSGVSRITAERERQVTQEGWSPDHDDEHRNGELAAAAACYAACAKDRFSGWPSRSATPPPIWPWEDQWWKPSDTGNRRRDAIRDLEKAGALIAAEIDRIRRLG